MIRAGFGIFYNAGHRQRRVLRHGPQYRGPRGPHHDARTPITWSNAIPGGSGTVVQVPPPFAWAAAYDHATPYTMQYLLNVQRQFGGDWVVEVGYLGSQSHHLYGFQNINQASRALRQHQLAPPVSQLTASSPMSTTVSTETTTPEA